jgi:hypothetical protein
MSEATDETFVITPWALLTQNRQGGLRDQESTAGVDAHDPLPGLEVDPLAPSIAETHPDVVVNDVQRPEVLERCADHPPAILLDAHISDDDRRRSTDRANLTGRLYDRGLLVVEEDHPSALAREQDRGGTSVADPLARRLAGAGHDRDLAREPALSSLRGAHPSRSARAMSDTSGGSGSRPVVAISLAIAM